MQVGALIAFLSYLIQILMSVMMATFVAVLAPRASVSAERIEEVLDAESSVAPPAEPVTSWAPRARSSCATSSSSTPAPSTRCCATSRFKAVAGETTAIIGSTGSGKTTLLNLVPRLFDATGGTVLVDGVDVRDIEPELLWSRIGLVPQKPYLFSGTVASNLRYANPDATDDELWDALEIAQATRLRVRDARRARRADQPGRLQRLRRAAPAPRDRPGARPRAPASTSSTTRSPRSTSRPTRACAPRSCPWSRTR